MIYNGAFTSFGNRVHSLCHDGKKFRASHLAVGENHYAAKLTWPVVREIRAKAKIVCETCGRTPTYKELGALYGVSAVMIFKIVRQKSWHPHHDPALTEAV